MVRSVSSARSLRTRARPSICGTPRPRSSPADASGSGPLWSKRLEIPPVRTGRRRLLSRVRYRSHPRTGRSRAPKQGSESRWPRDGCAGPSWLSASSSPFSPTIDSTRSSFTPCTRAVADRLSRYERSATTSLPSCALRRVEVEGAAVDERASAADVPFCERRRPTHDLLGASCRAVTPASHRADRLVSVTSWARRRSACASVSCEVKRDCSATSTVRKSVSPGRTTAAPVRHEPVRAARRHGENRLARSPAFRAVVVALGQPCAELAARWSSDSRCL